jgi:hypothetical protein
MISIDATLPVKLIERLINCPGVVINNSSLVLNDSKPATNLFFYYLRTYNAIYENGPVLRPYFGSQSYPYIDPIIQEEVKKVIDGCCHENNQYNSNKSIYSMYSDLQQIPSLKKIESEKMICELNIIYSNMVIIIPIKTI